MLTFALMNLWAQGHGLPPHLTESQREGVVLYATAWLAQRR